MLQLSVWEKESFYAPKDIVIAGSGLVGLWSAYYLKRLLPAANILILEKGIIPAGASTRNAGFACYGSVTELLEDARNMGTEKMLELVSMRYDGLRRIRKTFPKSVTGYEKFGGYELINATQYPKIKQLKNDIGWLNITLRKVLKEDQVFRMADKKIKIFGFAHTSHLVENKGEAQLHSGKLLQALLQLVQGMGVQVLTQIDIKGFEKKSGMISLHTNLPFALTCEKLLVCTNGFAKQLLPELDVMPARGQVLLTAPLKNTLIKGTFHFNEGFYYFRNLGNRILLGGARNLAIEEESTSHFQTTDLIQQELERYLKEVVLPKRHFSIEQRWSGIMGMGSEKMPIIKKLKKNIYCAVRMSGMGVALAPVAGEKAAKLVLEKE